MKLMMRFMLLVMFLCFSSAVMAQDIIVKKDGTTIKAKVEKVTDSVVEYKKFTNLTGPTYTIKITDLLAINYENGETEKFGDDGISSPSSTEVQINPGERRLSDAELLNLAHPKNEKPKKIVINEELYKKGKKMKTAGWIVGGAIATSGILTFLSLGIVDEWDEVDFDLCCSLPIFGGGLAIGIPLICAGQHKIKQAQRIQSTSFYQYEIPLGNNATMTADVNLMKNELTHQYSPALGFHVNF